MIEQLTRALLYEGWVLYPYRASAPKNQRRFAIGSLFPRTWCEAQRSDPAALEAQFLHDAVLHEAAPQDRALRVAARFLHTAEVERGAERWTEALEREVWLELPADDGERTAPIALPAAVERGADGVVRRQAALSGRMTARAETRAPGLRRVTVRVENETAVDPRAPRQAVEPLALVSAHVLVTCQAGAFVSHTDPPLHRREAVAACRQSGVWPVLVGPRGSAQAILAAPIILEDHPRLAPESPGDFCDGTEIDEMLALRVLTLAPAEKARLRAEDPVVRGILQRTEGLSPAALAALHGRARRGEAEVAHPSGRTLRRGDRVRLCPRGRRADAIDLLLRGRTATVEAVEVDLEDQAHLAVTIDDDPGQDLGRAGWPGHRFFFALDDVEPL